MANFDEALERELRNEIVRLKQEKYAWYEQRVEELNRRIEYYKEKVGELESEKRGYQDAIKIERERTL